MAARRTRVSRQAAGVLTLLVAACGGGGGARPLARELDALFHDDVPEVTRIGSEDDPVRSFSWVVDVAVSPDGSHVVVLDNEAPFVRLFVRDSADRALVPRGEGPGESRSVQGVAAGANGFLLLDQGVKLFDWNGDLITEGLVPGFTGLAAVAGCTGCWFVYGPGHANRGLGWLRSIHISPDSFSADLLFADTVSGSYTISPFRGLSGAGSHFVLFHKNGAPASMMTWSCPDPEPHPAPELDFLMAALAQPGQKDMGGGVIAMTLPVNEPMFGGLALLDGGLLWVENVMIPADSGLAPGHETRFRLVEGDSEFSATVAGNFTVHGATPGGAVWFSTYEPWPQVLLVDATALHAALRHAQPRRPDRAP
jgi:hypothetical protein